MQLNGSEIIIECLKEQGVDTVFGYPGGTILNVYDALYKHSGEIRHVLTSHEQGAAHAADGYARATGKVGVCMATSGPGATNLVTGIATAFMDSIPMVAITANVGVPLLGKDSFQEVDIAGVTIPITKYSTIVKDVNKLADTIRRAFKIAKSGRPGPVLVDVTKDVTANTCEYYPCKPEEILPDMDHITSEAMEKALELIKSAKKPMIFVGGGAILSDAAAEVTECVRKMDAPITSSLMGHGAFPETDPLYTGMIGMHGTKTSNFAVTKCDLLITIGARFSDRVTGNTKTFAKNAKILQIDVDPAEIDKNVKVDAAVIGDVKVVLRELNRRMPQLEHKEWVEWVEDCEKKYPMKYDKDILTGPYIIEELYRVTKGDAIVVTDVGQHQMWAAQYYPVEKPRSFLTSGSLGTMGFGLPAAIGAALANPDKRIVCYSGDGSIMMNVQEMATLCELNLPVTIIVFQNGTLGMVYQQQKYLFKKNYSASVFDRVPDLLSIAKGFGLEVIDGDADPQWYLKAFDSKRPNKPCFVRISVDPEETVLPFVPGGKANIDAIMN